MFNVSENLFDDYENYIKIKKHLQKHGYKYLDESTRKVFSNGKFVIKVPDCEHGIMQNLSEHYLWTNRKKNRRIKRNNIKLLRCSLIQLYGIPCIKMPKIKILTWNQIINVVKEEWIHSLRDDAQVGKYNGRVVCYDYGTECELMVGRQFTKDARKLIKKLTPISNSGK